MEEKTDHFTVYYIKKVNRPNGANTGLSRLSTEPTLKILNKPIPATLEDRYKQYILSINNRMPFEEELDEWCLKHTS